MTSVNLVSKQGRQYGVVIPDPKPDFVSAYVFAFTRGGSTLMNDMLATYCQQVKVPTFSLFNAAFDQGVPTQDIKEDASVCFKKHGYIYLGFRHFPSFEFDLRGAPAILLVRDPRDMLVSLYYSVLKSHVIPEGLVSFTKSRKQAGELDINQFVIIRAKSFARQFKRYQNKLSISDLTVYRYEDVIYEKEKWLKDMVTRLGLPQTPELVQDIAKRFDIVPDVENENKHVRQVHPGNHTQKLNPQTICSLNDSLADFLRYFKYEN